MPPAPEFRFSIDRGGTFTDIYAEVPGSPGVRVLKLLSENPSRYCDAPREGIRQILQESLGIPVSDSSLESGRIDWIRMGTTLATNALLERTGARVGLVITRGFGDLLQIGKQNRPKIFDLRIETPDLLYEKVVEIDERVRPLKGEPGSYPVQTGVTGERFEIVAAPPKDAVRRALQPLRDSGISSLAVVLAHASAFPNHEQLVGEVARAMGFAQVSLSFEVMPRVKLVDRGQTACVDAYLNPVIQDYLHTFRQGFLESDDVLRLMQSDGSLVPGHELTGSRAILSGPAGGVVGFARTTDCEGSPVIGFDMGGTSTDVSRYDGEFEWAQENFTAGVHLLTPQLDIQTVAAGGGSRLFFRNGMFVVGPESSGAQPGPVCYGNDGYLSITDANLMLGRLLPEHFPKTFGPKADQPLDVSASRRSFETLYREIKASPASLARVPESLEEIALGFVKVANEMMARPIREITLGRGLDVRDHVLACFGGAGGQHACSLARVLGIGKVFVHRYAGILSAYGLGLADEVEENRVPVNKALDAFDDEQWLRTLDKMSASPVETLAKRGFTPERIAFRNYLFLRYEGTTAVLMVEADQGVPIRATFENLYRREFGFDMPRRAIHVDDLLVRVIGRSRSIRREPVPRKQEPASPLAIHPCYFDRGWLDTPVHSLEDLGAGEVIFGPAILLMDTSTLVVEPDCQAIITDYGDVSIEILQTSSGEISEKKDPVQLSVFANRFMSIAEQMGRVLQRSAISTNIKERHDFSCAVFGPSGDLVANAPHQPVHLGSMGEAVRYQIEKHGATWQAGEVIVSNHPRAGGSHLPDITVISPVMQNGEAIFYVANRGHHADVGGISPGSMPAFSRTLDEEGVSIDSFKLVQGGKFQEAEITRIFNAEDREGCIGTRALKDVISDLKAQVAANRKGIELLNELVDHYSLPVVQAYMGHIVESAEDAVQGLLKEVSQTHELNPVDTLKAEDYMDDGTPVRLQLTIDRDRGSAVFDFTGTGSEVAGNWNAPPTVTLSAIIYCLRCLVTSDIPLNQGCLNPVEVILPDGSILSPSANCAVAGGNVLTSQRVTDVIFKVFGAVAASQGCMNNLTFGNDEFGYYETIGGGAGAGPGWHGRSGVHTHMTNTQITDPEILERRYPVLLREFGLRKGSGGEGLFRGGDGLIRDIEFLEPLTVTLLTERRIRAPFGLQGGGEGQCGKNLWIKPTGETIDLGGKNEFQAQPGDRLVIQTPGGGGFGSREL